MMQVHLDEFSWQSEPVPWSGGLGRALLWALRQCLRHDSEFGPLEIASGSRRRKVANQRLGLESPFVSPACALLLRARVNVVTAACWARNPLGVEQNIGHLTNLALVSSQTS